MMSVERLTKVVLAAGTAIQINRIAPITTRVFSFSCKQTAFNKSHIFVSHVYLALPFAVSPLKFKEIFGFGKLQFLVYCAVLFA